MYAYFVTGLKCHIFNVLKKSIFGRVSLTIKLDGTFIYIWISFCSFLNETFPHRWIGRNREVEWPHHSPDLITLDFFLWVYLKAKVYSSRPQNLEMLENKIRYDINKIRPGMFNNARNEFFYRLGYCQIVNMELLEQLIR